MNSPSTTNQEPVVIIFATPVFGTTFYVNLSLKVECIDSGDFDLDCPMYECENAIEDFLIKKLLSES